MRDDGFEVVQDDALGDRESLAFDVGRVHHEKQHLAVFKNGEFFYFFFCWHTIDVIELDIACVHDVTPRSFDDDAHRIGDSVGHIEESYSGRAERNPLVLLDFADHDGLRRSEFFLALFDDFSGEAARVDRRVANALDDVGNSTDVIEVTVRDEESSDFFAAFFKVASVGQDVVDAGRLDFRELEAGVDNKDVARRFNGDHVAAYFFDAAERNNADRIRCGWRNHFSFDALPLHRMFEAHFLRAPWRARLAAEGATTRWAARASAGTRCGASFAAGRAHRAPLRRSHAALRSIVLWSTHD